MNAIGGLFVALVLLGIAVIFGILIVGMFKGMMEWHSNNQQPIQTVPAMIVAKRAHVWGGGGDSSAHTTYYVTFELTTGERREFVVPSNVYGLLAEGDQGQLSLQGTRFKDYTRSARAQLPVQGTW